MADKHITEIVFDIANAASGLNTLEGQLTKLNAKMLSMKTSAEAFKGAMSTMSTVGGTQLNNLASGAAIKLTAADMKKVQTLMSKSIKDSFLSNLTVSAATTAPIMDKATSTLILAKIRERLMAQLLSSVPVSENNAGVKISLKPLLDSLRKTIKNYIQLATIAGEGEKLNITLVPLMKKIGILLRDYINQSTITVSAVKIDTYALTQRIQTMVEETLLNSTIKLKPINLSRLGTMLDKQIATYLSKAAVQLTDTNVKIPVSAKPLMYKLRQHITTVLENVPITIPLDDVANLSGRISAKLGEGIRKTRVPDLNMNVNDIGVPFAQLSAELKRKLALNMKMTVAQISQQAGTGTVPLGDAMKAEMQLMQERMIKAMMKRMVINANRGINAMIASMKTIQVPPDHSMLPFLQEQYQKLQMEVVKKAKEIIKRQFKAMFSDVRGITINPVAGTAPGTIVINRPSPSNSGTLGGGAGGITPFNPVANDAIRALPEQIAASMKHALKFLTAGALLGIPMTALMDSWKSFKEFEFNMVKGNENFYAKYRNSYDYKGNPTKPFEDLAAAQINGRMERTIEILEKRDTMKLELDAGDKEFLDKFSILPEDMSDPVKKSNAVNEQRLFIENFMNKDLPGMIQDLGINYGITQKEVSEIYMTASRSTTSPMLAYDLSAQASKLYAADKGDITTAVAVKGLEAVKSQWDLQSGADLEKYSNMLVKAAAYNQATVADLLNVQMRAGSIFRTDEMAAGVPKEKAFARSLALSTVFAGATARPGAEGGTFFRNVLRLPYTQHIARYLGDLSGGVQYTDKATGEKKNLDLSYLKAYNTTYDEKGRSTSKTRLSQYDQFNLIARAYIDLMNSGNEDKAQEMITKIYQKRASGTQMAITQSFKDLDKAYQKLNPEDKERFKSGKGLDVLVESIQKASPEEVDEYVGALRSTTMFNQESMKSTFQAMMTNLLKGSKPTVDGAMKGLTLLFRTIKNHSETLAKAMGFATQALLGLALLRGVKRVGSAATGSLAMNRFDNTVTPLLGTRRANVMDSYKTGRELERLELAQKTALTSKPAKATLATLNRLETLRPKADRLLTQRQARYAAAQSSGASQSTLDRLKANMDRAEGRVNRLNALGDSTTQRRLQLTANPVLQERLNQARAAHEAAGGRTAQSSGSIDRMQRAYREMGFSADQVNRRMLTMQQRFRSVALAEQHLSANTNNMALNMRRLDTAFDEGAIDARAYAASIARLNRAQEIATRRGTLLGHEINRQGSIGSRIGATASNTVSTMGMGILSGIKGGLMMAGATLAMDFVTAFADSLMKTDAEKLVGKAQLKKSAVTTLQQHQDSGFIQKSIIGLTGLYNIGKNALGLGGYDWDEWNEMRQAAKEGTSLQDTLEKSGVVEDQASASKALGKEQRAMADAYRATWIDVTGDGKGDVAPDVAEGAFETVQEMLDITKRERELADQNISTVYALQRNLLSAGGSREDSDEMRALNIGEINEKIANATDNLTTLDYAVSAREQMNPDLAQLQHDPGYMALKEAQLKMDEEISQMRLAVLQKEMEQMASISAAQQRSIDLVAVDIDKQMAETLAGGARKDSLKTILLEQEAVNQSMLIYTEYIGELNDLLSSTDEGSVFKSQKNEKGEETNSRRIDLTKQLKDSQLKESQMKAQAVELDAKELEDLKFTTDRALNVISTQEGIDLANLGAKGMDAESGIAKYVSRAALENKNNVLAEEMALAQVRFQKAIGDENKTKVFEEMKQIELQQAQNLEKIYKLMDSGGTFGVPTGLNVMTNYDYYASRGTEGSMQIQQGGLNITMQIDKVYATDTQTAEEALQPLKTAIENMSKNVASDLNQQVSRNVANYRGRF